MPVLQMKAWLSSVPTELEGQRSRVLQQAALASGDAQTYVVVSGPSEPDYALLSQPVDSLRAWLADLGIDRLSNRGVSLVIEAPRVRVHVVLRDDDRFIAATSDSLSDEEWRSLLVRTGNLWQAESGRILPLTEDPLGESRVGYVTWLPARPELDPHLARAVAADDGGWIVHVEQAGAAALREELAEARRPHWDKQGAEPSHHSEVDSGRVRVDIDAGDVVSFDGFVDRSGLPVYLRSWYVAPGHLSPRDWAEQRDLAEFRAARDASARPHLTDGAVVEWHTNREDVAQVLREIAQPHGIYVFHTPMPREEP